MKSIFVTIICLNLSLVVQAQIDSTLLRRSPVDTTMAKGMNMDAVYNRPFLQMLSLIHI